MSQNPDVGISMEIQIQREKFQQELGEMKASFDSWKQQMTGVGIEIPTRLRDEATTQLAALMQSLQAQAMAGITIPVNVGGGGFGGGGGGGFPGMASNYAIAAAGALPMPLVQPMRGLPGPMPMPQFPGTFGMSRAELNANISEAAAAMTARQMTAQAMEGGGMVEAAALGGAAASGRSLMGGMRLFGGAMIAERGLTALFNSYSATMGDRDPTVDAGSEAALKEEIRRIKEYRSGFGGGVGIGRDVLHWVGKQFEPMAGGDDGFNDELRKQELEKSLKGEQQRIKSNRLQMRLLGLGQSATDFMEISRDEYDASTATGGLEQKEAEIKKQADRLADAYRKKADELERLSEDHSLPVQTQQKYRAMANNLRFEGQVVPAGIAVAETDRATREYGLAVSVRQASITNTIEGLGMSADAIRANLSGDTLGARLMGIGVEQQTSLTGLTNTYDAQRRNRVAGAMTQSQYYAQADAIMDLNGQRASAAVRQEMNTYQQQIDAVGLAGVGGNQYEQQRQAVRQGLADALRNDPAHEGFHRSGADFMMFRLRQQESRDIQREYEFHDVIAASGEDHPLIGFNPGRTGRSVRDLAAGRRNWGPGNARRAAELDWEHQQQDRLAQHLGQDPQDRALRESMQENIRQEARRRAQNESDPQARERLSNIARYGLSPRASDQLDSKELAEKGNAAMADMAAAVQQGVENALKSAKNLYVVR